MQLDLERIEQFVDLKVKEFHKTCLTDTFDNGRFWAFKEMQEFITHVKPVNSLNSKEQMLAYLYCIQAELNRIIELLGIEDYVLAELITKVSLQRIKDMNEILKDAK